MNENTNPVKRREWVKNAAIIFLTIMLVLTFFSNTIMNYSLPEVATEYVQSGTITEKVRGTGTLEATDPYNVSIGESRVISSVAVKQGDQVEKDQVLYYLEDVESDELKQAEKELEDLELAYMKGLFGNNVSSEIVSKVANGKTDGFGALQAKVTDMQKRMDAAEKRVKECQDALNDLSLQSTVNTNNAGVNTIDAENAVTQADTELANAQSSNSDAEREFNRKIAAQKAQIENEINELKKQIADVQLLIDNAANVVKENNDATGNEPAQTTSQIDEYKKQRDQAAEDRAKAEMDRDNKLNAIDDAARTGGYTGNKNINELKAWIEASDNYNNYKNLLDEYDKAEQDYEVANAQYNYAIQKLEEAEKNLSGYDVNADALKALNDQLLRKQAELNNISSITYQPGDNVKTAQEKLNQAKQNLTDQTNANKLTSADYQNQIASAEAALKNAQAVYDLLKEEQAEMNADINAELDLTKTNKDIADKQAEIEKLKAKATGSSITAPVAGTVSSVALVAGEKTQPEETLAVILPAGKGFTLSFSATTQQAKKLSPGDIAELQNAWYYDNVKVTLASIKPDPDDPAQKKLLTFDVEGDVQAGQSLSLSVGQRSSNYELVVPNSAIREDKNGKFILIVESKSSPLGNRYIATRVDVEALASDDTHTAISAGLYGYEYVITTATKPVEAGKQVRLAD